MQLIGATWMQELHLCWCYLTVLHWCDVYFGAPVCFTWILL